MTAKSEVTEAMLRLHARDHSMLGCMLVYLHANTAGEAERAAVLNNALDAVFNFAMLLCDPSQRAAVQEQLAARILTCDTTIYPSLDELKSNTHLHELFRAGLSNMASDTNFMDLLGAMMIGTKETTVNDKLH